VKLHRLTCKNCLNEFETKDKRRVFCSRSCSATLNNTLHPKNPKRGKCKDCSTPILSGSVRCKECHIIWKGSTLFEDKTLDEMKIIGITPSNIYAAVRYRARATAKKMGWKQCAHCGYDKHIEIAHKKAISDFEGNTLVSIINSKENLLPLCPNCHWEFDNL
jgi:hypothetical protein